MTMWFTFFSKKAINLPKLAIPNQGGAPVNPQGNNRGFVRQAWTFLAVSLMGFGVSACQDKVLIQDKNLFSENVVRLGDTIVAQVEGTQIYLSDVENAALAKSLIKGQAILTPANPIFQQILDELIDQRLLALEALRQSLDQNDETRRRLAIARERILSNVVIEDLIAKNITPETMGRMYEEQTAKNTKGEQVRARKIVLETQKQAKAIVKRIDDGEKFATLAKKYSLDVSTRDLGGDLGYFQKGGLQGEIENLSFATKKGEMTEPFETEAGWVVVKVENRRPIPVPSYENIKDEIENFMTLDSIDKFLKTLRAQSVIELKLGQATNEAARKQKP